MSTNALGFKINFTSVANQTLAFLSSKGCGIIGTVIGPLKAGAEYLFPRISDPGRYTPIQNEGEGRLLHSRVTTLASACGLCRSLRIATKQGASFSSGGGSYSLSSPTLYLPQEIISPRVNNNLEDPLAFTEAEQNFLIAREIHRISKNYQATKLILKIALAALTVFAICTTGTVAVWVIYTLGLVPIVLFDRQTELELDTLAVTTLNERGENGQAIARSTLEKIRQRNLYARNTSWIQKLYFTSSGEERFALSTPSIEERRSDLSNPMLMEVTA